jgi:hypothetical protein
MKRLASFILLLSLCSLHWAIKIDDELELNLELIKHQPCTYKPGKDLIFFIKFTFPILDKAKWQRKLEFEGKIPVVKIVHFDLRKKSI